MSSYFEEYKRSLYDAAYDEDMREALRRAVASYREQTARALARYPRTKELKKVLREVKERVLADLSDYVKMAMESIELVDGHAYFAKTAEDALKVVDEVVGEDKLVVKSKSLTSEELNINEHLEARGNTVYETDLGEFIVQIMKSRPMHILSPSIHVTKERVAVLFSKFFGREIEPEAGPLASAVREFMRSKFFEADVGITGANAIIADTGSVILIENEGNIRFVSNAPPVHLVIAGVEKILPTMADGATLIEVVSRYASYYAPSYVSIISGPSKTGDIEKVRIFGMHGPREVHVVLLDNGRSGVAADPLLRQMLYCIRCGGCMFECPVYAVVAGYWGYKYMGGIGIPWTAFIVGGLEKAAPMAYTCTLCGRCVRHCPMEIDIPALALKVRELAARAGLTPPPIEKVAEAVRKGKGPYEPVL